MPLSISTTLTLAGPSEEALNAILTGPRQFESISITWPHLPAPVLPDTLQHQHALTYLSLGFAEKLTSLPDCLHCIPLQVLDVDRCVNVMHLPPSLALSTTLRTLIITDNQMPDWLFRISSLRTLALRKGVQNAGLCVPSSVFQCTQLTALTLHYRSHSPRRDSLSSDIAMLIALQTLTIAYGCMTALPDSIGKLSALRQLVIKSCWHLATLPESCGQLPHLENLTLTLCRSLTCLPRGLVRGLLRLDANGTPLVLDPGELDPGVLEPGELCNLKCLHLRDFETVLAARTYDTLRESETVPAAHTYDTLRELTTTVFSTVSAVPWLQELTIEDDRCHKALPKALGHLTRLRLLSIRRCVIETLPDNLTTLERLAVAECTHLSAIPVAFRTLHSLEVDDTTPVVSIPDTFTDVMCALWIEGCAVAPAPWLWTHHRWQHISLPCLTREVPLGFFAQPMMQSLSFAGCSDLTVLPEGNVHLPVLKSLHLNDTGIEMLPTWLTRLSNLRTLSVARCESLTSLPEAIGNLSMLECLNVVGLSITAVPASVGQLRRLPCLDLEGCARIQHLPSALAEIVVKPLWLMLIVRRYYYAPQMLLLILAGRRGQTRLPSELWRMVQDIVDVWDVCNPWVE